MPAALLPAADVTGRTQGPICEMAAGFRAGHPAARAVAVIGGLVGWRIPGLTAAHYLISFTIDLCRMHGSSVGTTPPARKQSAEILSKLADEATVAFSQDRGVFTLSAAL